MSKSLSISHKKIGFFCYKCGRDDFGNNQKSLSAHVRYCFFDPYSNSQSKRKSDNRPTCLHSSGTSPYPFLVKKTRVSGNDASGMDDVVQYECDNSDEIQNADENIFDTGCAEDDGTAHVVDLTHQATVSESSTERIHCSIANSDDDAVNPFNSNCSLPPSYQFQLDLLATLSKHRIDLNVHDEIIHLIKQHSSDQKLHFSSDTLQNRHVFLKKIERNLSTEIFKPKDVLVKLKGGGQANVSIFNLEAMILSLVLDDNLMHSDNIAEGYDIFTGKGGQPDDVYGEIHTGDAWEPARQHFCGDDQSNIPLALIIFGDKSHLDLHGTLSTLPITFTISCFNEQSRNKTEFWRPLAFIPNLSYGATSSKNSSKPLDSVQDEHDCLKVCFSSLVDIHKRGGISTTLMGRPVVLKVWIHYFVGDTSGNNRWLGHFNGSGKMTCP